MDWFEAARIGALDALEAHLGSGQDVGQTGDDQRTALHVAAEHGQTAAVKWLLERGANPNADAPGVDRPLTIAIRNEHWDTAAALVRGGADPNADGVASIVIASPPKRQLFALMLKHGLDANGGHPDFGPYVQFALNDSSVAQMLFDAGFDLARYERETGESLLERALMSDDETLLHQLLRMGADVNLPVDRRSGRTLLMQLVGEEPGEQRDVAITRLVKHAVDVEATDAEGRTAIDVAQERGHEATVAWLVRLRDSARRAKERAAEAARIAAEQEAERQRRSEIAKKAAEARRLAKEALQAKRLAAAQKAAATRAANKKAAAKKVKAKPKTTSVKKSAKKLPKPKAKRPAKPKPKSKRR